MTVSLCCALSFGSNLANPAVSIPDARVAVGASYHLGGYTITNSEVLSMMNRVHGRVSYSPIRFVNFGVDLGATQVEVDKYGSGSDSIPVFHGNFGFSGGGHLKLTTPPMVNGYVALLAIGQGTIFTSENEYGATYGGKDGIGAVGVQIHIPRFGYVSAGPLVYLIRGDNESYTGVKGHYSNLNNIRGWLAVDYFPKLATSSSTRPYFSLEVSASPEAEYDRRIPAQEWSISISIGSVTQRLYGVNSDVEWEP